MRLVSSVSFQSSSVSAVNGFQCTIPALETRMSILPNRERTFSTKALLSPGERTSATWVITDDRAAPAASTSRAVSARSLSVASG
jgi:hypothetical protein